MENKELFIVRLYDGFDHEWMDISDAITKEEAEKILEEKTEGGTINTKFGDIDYYRIFPSDVKMVFSSEGKEIFLGQDQENG